MFSDKKYNLVFHFQPLDIVFYLSKKYLLNFSVLKENLLSLEPDLWGRRGGGGDVAIMKFGKSHNSRWYCNIGKDLSSCKRIWQKAPKLLPEVALSKALVT